MVSKSEIVKGMQSFLCHVPYVPSFPMPVDTLNFAVSDLADQVFVHAGKMKVFCTNVCHLQPCYIVEINSEIVKF